MGVRKVILLRGFSMLGKLDLYRRRIILIDLKVDILTPVGRKLSTIPELKNIKLMDTRFYPRKIVRLFSTNSVKAMQSPP